MLSLKVWYGLDVGIVDAENSVPNLEQTLAGSPHKHLQYIDDVLSERKMLWLPPWWSPAEFPPPQLRPLSTWSPRPPECHLCWAPLGPGAPPTDHSQPCKYNKRSVFLSHFADLFFLFLDPYSNSIGNPRTLSPPLCRSTVYFNIHHSIHRHIYVYLCSTLTLSNFI